MKTVKAAVRSVGGVLRQTDSTVQEVPVLWVPRVVPTLVRGWRLIDLGTWATAVSSIQHYGLPLLCTPSPMLPFRSEIRKPVLLPFGPPSATFCWKSVKLQVQAEGSESAVILIICAVQFSSYHGLMLDVDFPRKVCMMVKTKIKKEKPQIQQLWPGFRCLWSHFTRSPRGINPVKYSPSAASLMPPLLRITLFYLTWKALWCF